MGLTYSDTQTMVASFNMKFAKPSSTGGCDAGYSLAISYGIEASNAQFPNGHMFGSIATIQGTKYQIPQQWAPTSDINKTTTTSGDKMEECVSGYPEYANGTFTLWPLPVEKCHLPKRALFAGFGKFA